MNEVRIEILGLQQCADDLFKEKKKRLLGSGAGNYFTLTSP